MATTQSTDPITGAVTNSVGTGFDAVGVGDSIGVPGDGAAGQVGVTGGGISAESTITGDQANFTVTVNVPVPFANLKLDLNLVGAFVLPIMAAVRVPKAMQFLLVKLPGLIQHLIDDATLLIMSLPDATFTIQVKVGPAVITSIQLIAEKVPVVITPPTFQLALPNFAVDLSLNIPSLGATIIRVPIPVPIYDPVPLLGFSGGQVSAGADITAPGQMGATGAGMAASATGGGAGILGPSVTLPTISNPTFPNNVTGTSGAPLPGLSTAVPLIPTVTNPIYLPHI